MSRVPGTRKQLATAPPPPGTIGVVSGELGRFTEFSISMMRVIKPPGTQVNWVMGLDITANCNRIIEGMAPSSEWLWIMGDDHVFDPLILVELLARDVDVVVPLCLQRQAPFRPVVYSGIEGEDHNGFPIYTVAELPPTGIREVYAAGSAGMLIRRRVLDALERPIFSTSGFHQNEDLNLCEKIRAAGFKIHCDVDAHLGHIGIVTIFPRWSGGGWASALQSDDVWVYDDEEDERRYLADRGWDGIHRPADRQNAAALR